MKSDPATVRAIVVELQIPEVLREVLAELRSMHLLLDSIQAPPQPYQCALVERVVPVVCRVWDVPRREVFGKTSHVRATEDDEEVTWYKSGDRAAARDAAVELLCRVGMPLRDASRAIGVHRNWGTKLRERVAKWEAEDRDNYARLCKAAEEIGT